MKNIITTMLLSIGILFGTAIQDAAPASAMTYLENGFSYDESSVYITADTKNLFSFNVITYINGDESAYRVTWFGNDWNHVYAQKVNSMKGVKADKYILGASSPFVGMFRQVWYKEKGYPFS